MIEEQAMVVSVLNKQVSVEIQRKSTCSSCSAKSSCGTSLLERLFGQRKQRYSLTSDIDLKAGDAIIIGMDENAYLRGSFMVYSLPLIVMLLGAITAESFAGNQSGEFASIIGAAIGFAVGMLVVNRFGRRVLSDSRYQPVVLRRCL